MPALYTDRLDGISTSTAVKPPCRVATTANITLSGLQTIDGVTVAANDRVLVKDQTDATENGIWRAQSGAWTRALDFNGTRDVVGGTQVSVNSGAVNENSYWRVDGNGVVEVGTDNIAFAPAFIDDSASATFLQAGTGATARTIQEKLRDTISAKDFGAVGDGVTDDRAAIAAAVAAARGKTVYFPEGNYLINTDGGSITLEEVNLLGQEVLDGANAVIDQGVNFYITGTTNSPFKLRRGTSIAGFGWYYPDQPDSATPIAFPVTIDFDFTNGAVQFVNISNNVVYNAYRFIDVTDATGNVGHVQITDNYICGINRGIYLRKNLEQFRVTRNNFTFGFWLAATEPGTRGYMRANATAFQYDEGDGVEFSDNLVYGYLRGVLTAVQGNSILNHITLNKFDQARYCIVAEGSGNFSGLIASNTFNAFDSQDTAAQGNSIAINTTGSDRETITITGNNFMAATEDHILTTGNNPTRDIVVTGNNFLSWAAYKASGAYGAINANGALTNITSAGNWYCGANSAAYSNGIMGTFNVLTASANSFDTCFRPLSVTVSFTTGGGNVSFNTGDTASDQVSGVITWGPNNFDKPNAKTGLQMPIGDVGNYANDAAAAGGGVPVGGFYRNGSVLMVRAA